MTMKLIFVTEQIRPPCAVLRFNTLTAQSQPGRTSIALHLDHCNGES